MTLSLRSYSGPRLPAGLALAGTIFLSGFVAGLALGPRLGGGMASVAPPAPAGIERQSDNANRTSAGRHPAEILKVIDGDTFEARVNIWPGVDVTTRVRLRGIDAPELKARCDEEYAKALEARGTLGRLLAEGGVAISRVAIDKYGGRVVADASSYKTGDIAQTLLEAGMARRYSGGRRESWCR